MKRLFFLAAGALSFTLLSFVAPDNNVKTKPAGSNGITRIGPNEYRQTAVSVFTAAEQAVFDKLTQERYHIKNVQLAGTSSIEFESAQLGIWVYRRRKSTGDRFEETTIAGTAQAANADATIKAANAILAKYADGL